MNRKLISILLAVALTAGLLPAHALAADSTDTGVFIAGVQLELNKAYYNRDFWPLTEPTPEVPPSYDPSAQPTEQPTDPGEGASYAMTRNTDTPDWNAYLEFVEGTGYTLTINNLSVMGIAGWLGNAAIYSERALTIVLKGVNSAIGADGDWADGIYVSDQLVIEGDGTLTATGGTADYSSGISAGVVYITGDVTVIATGGTAVSNSYGISGSPVNITDGATVVATGGSAGGTSCGIQGESVNITSSTVIATGGDATAESYGINSYYPYYPYGSGTTITSSAVVARAGTVGGAFSGDNRKAINGGTVNLNSAELAGAVRNGTAQNTPTLDSVSEYTSVAIVPTSWTDEFPEAVDNTYNITDDTYIVSVDAVALDLDTDTAATINTDGHTLLAVSLSEDSGDTAGIRSTASVTLNGNIIAVGGLSTVGDCSGFEVPSEAGGETVTVNGTLLAVGAGTPSGYGTGYSSAVDTTVNGTLIGVGVSGAHTYGIYMPSTGNGTDLTVNGGTVLGYAGSASANEPIADGIYVQGELSARGSVTGVGAVHGLSGTQSVNGGAYLGKGRAVSPLVEPAYGYAFLNADGELSADYTEQYLTVSEVYIVTFNTEDSNAMLPVPHGQSVSATHAEAVASFTAMVEKDGYTFLGWYKSEDEGETLSNVKYDLNSEVTADVNLYPKWRLNIPYIPQPTDEPTDEPADDPYCPQDDTCPIARFDDADPTAWYHDGVHFCIERGLMIGTSETEFEPHSPTSRAMIAVMLHRLEGTPVNGQGKSGTFIDVEDYMWYTEAIEWAAATGIVEGHGDGTFAPNDDLTREQAAAILYRYVQYLGGGFTGMWAFRLDFDDLAEMSDWAYEGVSWCVMNGILEGDGNGLLRPGDSIERCEIATMLYRLCEVIAEQGL